MLEKLKKRWDLKSNIQIIIVLVVFAITGSTTLYAKKAIFQLLGITPDTELWIKVPLYVLIIFPVYQLLFLIFAFLFGQFRFAWEFEKKIFSRFKFKKK